MQITITTRHLLHLMKDSYTRGIHEANTQVFTDNPTGRPEQVASEILMSHLLVYNDAINQQT